LGDDLGENLGTGYIPKEKIVGKVKTKQAGVSDVADICRVRHKSGGVSNCTFKVYEQGWRKWQGSAPHLIWLDEEPEDMRIYDECQTRVLRTNGIIYATLTPLLGQTDLVRHFMSSKQDQIWWIGATWDDAPHLKEERKTQLRNSYPDHVVQARTLGVPMMGEGRIFVIPEEDIRVEPREIPRHWARIKGVDFGINHPSAIGDLAYDRDNDVIYLIRDWREKGLDASEHADAINKHDPWVPVAWPHDGTNKEKGSGKRLKEFYTSKGVKMLSRSACYKSDRLGSQPVEPIIQEINERCADGRFKVFSNCHAFFDEYRNYHRKDGRPIKIRDDVLKAVFYGVMMKRYATTQQVIQLHQNVPRAFSTSL
jgi:phage terminase large subunit-like protein